MLSAGRERLQGLLLRAGQALGQGHDAAAQVGATLRGCHAAPPLTFHPLARRRRLGNTPVVNGDENEPCATSQTLPPRVTLPIQCVRNGGVSATGRFLTLYRMRDQASDMYVCQVLVFLACECSEGVGGGGRGR